MLVHAECNGYIVGNWNLVKLLLSNKEIERYRVGESNLHSRKRLLVYIA